MSLTFWFLWGFSALVGLVVLYFFLAGLADQSVSGQNIGLWLILILVVAGTLLGSLWLKAAGKLLIAKLVLLVLAVPGLLYLLFLLIVLIGKPRWN